MTNVKNNILKRGSCVLLMLAMLLAFLPVNAFAADEEKAPPSSATFAEPAMMANYSTLTFGYQYSDYVGNITEVDINGAAYEKATYASSIGASDNKFAIMSSDGAIALGKVEYGAYNTATIVIKATGYTDLSVTVTKTTKDNKDTYSAVATVMTPATDGTYVLMNIPYSAFYAAEMDEGQKVAKVDALTSATKAKTLSTLAANSYHDSDSVTTNDDGTNACATISGVTYPVKISDKVNDYSALEKYTEVKDSDSVTYTVSLRGKKSSLTYYGKDALCGAGDYAYYKLVSKPAGYKELMKEDGSLSFGKATVEAQNVQNATISDVDTAGGHTYYEMSVSGFGAVNANNVSAVTLTTDDGNVYGLRHVAEIWRGTELGFDSSSALSGKTISKIAYYLNDGSVYFANTSKEVLPYYTGNVSALLSNEGKTEVTLYGLPSDIENAKVTISSVVGRGEQSTNIAENASVDNGKVTVSDYDNGKTYTVTISSSNYGKITTTLVTADENGNVYGLTNVDFNTFYKSLNEGQGLTQNKIAVDTVTSATTTKVRNNKNVYFETEHPTITDGTNVLGVVVPVKMTLTEAMAAGISGVVANPSVYLEKNEDGSYKLVGTESLTKDVEATLTSNTAWGDYQINLSDDSYGKAPATVYGVYLTANDGTQYALRQGENMWTPRNIYEFAWSTGVTTKEPHGCTLNPAHYESMEGKTISSVTYITTDGIQTYSFANSGLKVNPHFGEYTASVVKGTTTMTLSGLPEDITNAKVTVSTGRPATYLAQNVSIVNGKVTLTGVPDADKTYTVVVESDNYAARKTTLVLKNGSSIVTPSNPSTPVDPTPASRFTDVSADAWYADAVNTAAEKGLMAGVGNNKFDPNGIVERCQVAQIIWNMAGSPAVTGTTPFVDVASNAWYTQAVVWAYQNQVVAGTSATTFAPAQSVTRQDFACMLYRYAGSPKTVTDLSKFTDANAISAYAQDAVQWAVSKGIISGNDLSQLNPKGYLTRAEAASIIVRYVG